MQTIETGTPKQYHKLRYACWKYSNNDFPYDAPQCQTCQNVADHNNTRRGVVTRISVQQWTKLPRDGDFLVVEDEHVPFPQDDQTPVGGIVLRLRKAKIGTRLRLYIFTQTPITIIGPGVKFGPFKGGDQVLIEDKILILE